MDNKIETREARTYERLFGIIKKGSSDGMEEVEENIVNAPVGELIGLQSLVLYGISDTLHQAANLELAKNNPNAQADILQIHGMLSQADKQLAILDRLLTLVVSEITSKMAPQTTTEKGDASA